MCRPPRISANLEERTARRSGPATLVGCVYQDILHGGHASLPVQNFEFLVLWSHVPRGAWGWTYDSGFRWYLSCAITFGPSHVGLT